MDPTYRSRSTGGASGAFDGNTTMGLEGSRYGQAAIRIDVSGCLDIIDKKKYAGTFWAGTDWYNRLHSSHSGNWNGSSCN